MQSEPLFSSEEEPRQEDGMEDAESASQVTTTIHQARAETVNAANVNIRQGFVKLVNSGAMLIRQGAALQVKSERIEITGGVAGFIKTDDANLNVSRSGAVVSNGSVTMDQSAARAVLARGNVNQDQSANAVVIANRVHIQNSPTVFVLAKNVEGTITTSFGPQEAAVFGAVAGSVAGLFLIIARLLKKRK